MDYEECLKFLEELYKEMEIYSEEDRRLSSIQREIRWDMFNNWQRIRECRTEINAFEEQKELFESAGSTEKFRLLETT